MESATITTENLILRPFQDDDSQFLYLIQSDSNSMQYTFCSKSLDESRSRLQAYASQLNQLGFAPWTIIQKSNNEIIGWGGLNVDPFEPGWGTEVAYFFHPIYWGRGYATELVKASIQHGFYTLQLKKINAYVHINNHASIRVLEKCGLKRIRYVPELQRDHFQIKTT
jgi:ribosomal-protein-alanine N-acetyltransferase